MSLFEAPLLKSETVTFADTEFELFELSAFDRCEYLEKTTGTIPAPKDGQDPPTPEFETLGQFWALSREDVSAKLTLVAYALRPGREESLDALYDELRKAVPPSAVDDLYIPAAKLSGLYTKPVKAEEADEGAEKKD